MGRYMSGLRSPSVVYKPTVDDIHPALPIIRNIYHSSHSVGFRV